MIDISVEHMTMIVERLFFICLFFTCGVQPYVIARNETNSSDLFIGSGSCESGWLDASLVDLGCLYFLQETKVYYEANKFCQDKGSHLVEVHTRAQMDFLVMELQLSDEDEGLGYWWSGGSDSGREGQWYWQHSLTPVEDFVWDDDFPRDLTARNYLCFVNTHNFKAIDCLTTTLAHSICQK